MQMEDPISSDSQDWILSELADKFYRELAESVDNERTIWEHIKYSISIAAAQQLKSANDSSIKSVLLVGYCGAGNLGGNIRVKYLHDFLKASGIRCTILLMGWDDYWSGHPDTIVLNRYFPLFFLKEIPKYDAVIACEGSMFKSFFSNTLTLMQSALLLIAQAYGIAHLAYGAEIGKMHEWLEKAIVPMLRSVPIFCRSEASYQLGKSLGLRVFEGVDSAWQIEHKKAYSDKLNDKLKIIICPVDPYQFPLKLNVSNKISNLKDEFRDNLYYDANPGKANQLKELMCEIGRAVTSALQGKNYEVHILAMDQMDNNACKVYQQLFSENTILWNATEDNSKQRLTVLENADLCITARYHAALLGIAQRVSVIGIGIDERIPNLFAEIDDSYEVLDYRDHELEFKLTAEIKEKLADNNDESDRIDEFIENSSYRLRVMNENVLRCLEAQWCVDLAKVDINGIWNKALLEVLISNGLRQVLVSNGSRNMNFLHCALSNPTIEVLQFNNEAQMAFFGLGLCQESQKQVLLVTTSGSAMLHCLPAIVEAYKQNLPLILISADRPAYMLAANASQTIDHLPFTKTITYYQAALTEPSDEVNAALHYYQQLKELNNMLNNAVQHGPLHLNLPQIGNLSSLDLFEAKQLPFIPKCALHSFQKLQANNNQLVLMQLKKYLETKFCGKGLIVAGAIPTEGEENIIKLAEASGFPILADITSNYRQKTKHSIFYGDILAYSKWMNTQNYDVIIFIGSAPVSMSMSQFLKMQSCPVLIIEYNKIVYHPGNNHVLNIKEPSSNDWSQLYSMLNYHDDKWLKTWQVKDQLIALEMSKLIEKLPFSELYAAYQIFNDLGYQTYFIGNSLPIRHANLLSNPESRSAKFYCNRGVSGIDGHLSTFAGIFHQSNNSSACVIGDLTFYHDQASLELLSKYYTNAKQSHHLFVLNNCGGKIFDFLRLSTEAVLPAPQQDIPTVAIEQLCKVYGIPYYRCSEKDTLKSIFSTPGLKIIELTFSENPHITDQYSDLILNLLKLL